MPLTNEQIEIRKTGIGASEAAAAIGVCPHRSPMHVYAAKTGTPVLFEESEPVEWGNRLEPVIADKYADVHGIELFNPQTTFRHRHHDWMIASPDRLVFIPDTRGKVDYGVEIKSAGFRQYDRWGDTADKLPPEYYVQVSWCMAVLDVPRWDMAVLLAGQEYREYQIERDMEFEKLLIEKAAEFWNNHVLKRVPPKADAMEATRVALSHIYQSHGGDWVGSGPEMDMIADDLKAATAAKDAYAERVDELKNKARAYIGENEGVIGDWGKIGWKADKRGRRILRPNWRDE